MVLEVSVGSEDDAVPVVEDKELKLGVDSETGTELERKEELTELAELDTVGSVDKTVLGEDDPDSIAELVSELEAVRLREHGAQE